MDDAEKLSSLRTLTHLVYALQAAGFVTAGLGWLAAIILNYAKRDDAAATWLESHFRWQIRTFWFGLLWGVIGVAAAYFGFLAGGLLVYLSGGGEAAGWAAVGGLLLFGLVGMAIGIADAVWIIYRIVKGWLSLAEGKPLSAVSVGT